jgi:hypothetical protein
LRTDGVVTPPSRTSLATYGTALLWIVVAHAVVTAVLRLVVAFDALVVVPDAAIDLLIRHDEVRRWFAGEWIYGDTHSANYPPATYTLLWPLVGWLPEAPMRALYGLSTAASLAIIGALAVRASGADRLAEKAFMAVFILPLGTTQITVFIGQLGLHVTAALLAAAVILLDTPAGGKGRGTLAADGAAAALLTFALVKPTLAVPAVVAILILTGRARPALLVGALYLGATLLAAASQDRSLVTLVLDWLGREDIMNLGLGSVNTYLWLHWLGFEGSMLAVSLVVLGAFAAWAWRHRHAPFHVLGVGAIVSRLWIHHRAFDDVILVILAVALFRVAHEARGRGWPPMVAALLLAGVYILGHAPYAYLSGERPALWLITEVGRTVAWLGALAFLLWHARQPAGRRPEAVIV